MAPRSTKAARKAPAVSTAASTAERLLLFDGRGELSLKSALSQCLSECVGSADASAYFQRLTGEDGQKKSICGAMWRRGSIAYRCLDCEIDPTAAVCAECFQGGDHAGHDYRIVHTSSGCCDCGDPTAWKRVGFCKHHGVAFGDDGAPIYRPVLPRDVKDRLAAFLDTVMVRLLQEVRRRRHARHARAISVVGTVWPCCRASPHTCPHLRPHLPTVLPPIPPHPAIVSPKPGFLGSARAAPDERGCAGRPNLTSRP